jgi:hypothetical protein
LYCIVIQGGYSYCISQFLHLVHNLHSRFSVNIVFLCMYSDLTNYLDPYMNITIFLIVDYILCFSLQMNLDLLCSILAVDLFIVLFAVFSGLLRAYSANE